MTMISFLSNLKNKKIILASNSPRRKALLAGLGVEFEIRVNPIKELIPMAMPAEKVASYLSKLKSNAYTTPLENDELLITSDTVVIANSQVLSKPTSTEDAFEMIKSLSGITHKVMTAVTFKDKNRQITVEDETLVSFRSLEDEEIRHYISLYQPFDKAGGYGIQEWIGFIGISKIEGSYYNVMGFPLHLVYEQLKKWE